MSSNTGAGGNGNQMVCDMDEHGTNGDMKSDALNVAGTALETYQEEKDISRHIKVSRLFQKKKLKKKKKCLDDDDSLVVSLCPFPVIHPCFHVPLHFMQLEVPTY